MTRYETLFEPSAMRSDIINILIFPESRIYNMILYCFYWLFIRSMYSKREFLLPPWSFASFEAVVELAMSAVVIEINISIRNTKQQYFAIMIDCLFIFHLYNMDENHFYIGYVHKKYLNN